MTSHSKWKIALVVGGIASIACSHTSGPHLPDPLPPEDPWELIAQGRLQQAQEAFEARASQAPTEAAVGRLVLAQMGQDEALIRSRLADLPQQRTDELDLIAGEASLLLAKPTERERTLAERACRLVGVPALSSRARTVCSKLALADRHPERNVCVSGCDQPVEVPMSFAGNSPAISVSVNGGAPALFIVDSGAATAVVSRAFADAAGLHAVPGTAFDAHSSSGPIATKRTVMDLEIGPMKLAAVEAVIMDLPFGSVAGIISPHHTLRHSAVTLDFREFTLRMGPTPDEDPPLADSPLLVLGGNPVLHVHAPGRPRRPFTLDTGAASTILYESFVQLGPPLERSDQTRTQGAGGKYAQAWRTKTTLDAEIGRVPWSIANPTIVARHGHEPSRVPTFGLLGMDFLIGRRLVFDTPNRRVRISSRAELPAWPEGATARFKVSGSEVPDGVTVVEKVVTRTADRVGISVEISHPSAATRFELVVPDTWSARGTWLFTRPASEAWVWKDADKRSVAVGDLAQQWKAAFSPIGFKPNARNGVSLRALRGTLDGNILSCTETSLAADTARGPGRFAIVECPATPWRTTSVSLAVEGRTLWRLERDGFTEGGRQPSGL